MLKTLIVVNAPVRSIFLQIKRWILAYLFVLKKFNVKQLIFDKPKEGEMGENHYSNILRILPPKKMKSSGSVHISTQKIDCAYLLEPPRQK